jgi:hypothetical protein
MNKYKLIKKYPNSPELGMVVVKGTVGSDDKYPEQYGSLDNTMFFTVKEIENYPEFWEKVKDYEILELSFKRSERPEIRSVIGYSKDYLEALIKCENTIYSVKRLSDNVIFTVRDKVKQSNVQHNNTFTITRFEFDVNNEHLLVIGNGGIKLHKIEHVKKPLFTTEDGVEIFEGDYYYSVLKEDLLYHGKFKAEAINGGRFSNPESCIVFSTKEKAEEYIVMNKPCLSINEIGSIIGRFNNTVYVDLDLMNKKLKELVKDKI